MLDGETDVFQILRSCDGSSTIEQKEDLADAHSYFPGAIRIVD